jgi:hypothetical protein
MTTCELPELLSALAKRQQVEVFQKDIMNLILDGAIVELIYLDLVKEISKSTSDGISVNLNERFGFSPQDWSVDFRLQPARKLYELLAPKFEKLGYQVSLEENSSPMMYIRW